MRLPRILRDIDMLGVSDGRRSDGERERERERESDGLWHAQSKPTLAALSLVCDIDIASL